MKNNYPTWLNLLVVSVVAFGILVALPNVYGVDQAVQVSLRGSNTIPEGLLPRVKSELSGRSIEAKNVYATKDRVVVAANDGAMQENIKAALAEAFADDVEYEDAAVALTDAPRMPAWMRAIGLKPMSLGLDLRGGVHFLFEVDMEGAIDQAMERYVSDIKRYLRDDDIRYRDVVEMERSLRASFRSDEDRDKARKLLRDQYPEFEIIDVNTGGQPGITATLTDQAIKDREDLAIEQNITTMRNRVNEVGLSEPVVQRQGRERIVVELPGVQDPEDARELLKSTATLEYRMADEANSPELAVQTKKIPLGTKLYYQRNGQPVLLKRDVIVTGDNVINAASGYDQNGLPAVTVNLDAEGAKRMEENTRENLRKPMAVVFIETEREIKTLADGSEVSEIKKVEEVISIATIQGVFGARFQTTGLEAQESVDLARLLKAGALAAPIFLVEERTVGPSLGQQNIEAGKNAVMIGFILVVIFMIIYYRMFGLFANFALLTNVVLIVALLSLLPTSLTLPGIAGIVLTVGMAVDANVLIFERIREELRNGSSPQASIYSGYEKAFWSIADANITTLIAAVVLLTFGTGPIRGFAVTLALGIVTSMFTAIIGTRALANWLYGNRQLKDLPI